MSITGPEYTTGESITIDVTSLGVDKWYESDVIDNTTDEYTDAQLGFSIQVGAVTVGGVIGVYLYSLAFGSTYTSSVSGSEAEVDWGTTPSATSLNGFLNLERIAFLEVGTADNKDIVGGVKSVAALFGGWLPIKWGIVVHNNTDVALHATGTNNTFEFTGIRIQNN